MSRNLGQTQFILPSLDGWRGFDVGSSDDFEQEVKTTTENQELAAFVKEERPRTTLSSRSEARVEIILIARNFSSP